MNPDKIVFDSAIFWDLAGERHMFIPGGRDVSDISMVPLPGDRISLVPHKGDHITKEGEPEDFIVVHREFRFRPGTCTIKVNVQPVSRVGY